MKHIKRIKIDIDKKNFKVIPSVQFDNARFLHINLVNGSMLFDLTGCSVKISGTKPDGTIIFNNCTIINEKEGFIEVELTEQINAVPGIVKCELKLYDGNGVLTTKNFDIEVSASATANGITSSNEFKALTDALKVVQGIDNKADKEKVEEKFGEVYEQLDTKALRSDLIIERERINNLTKLGEGSTTGDAELIDGRVGEDGVTYKNIGEAIRNQFSDTKAVTSQLMKFVSANNINIITTVHEGFLTAKGNFSTDTTLHCKTTNRIYCDEGWEFSYYGRGRFQAMSYVMYKGNTIVKTGQHDMVKTKVVIPSGVDSIVFSSYGSKSENIRLDVELISPKFIDNNNILSILDSKIGVAELDDDFRNALNYNTDNISKDNMTKKSDVYVSRTGGLVEANGFNSYELSVQEREIYSYQGYAIWATAPYLILNSEGNTIDVGGDGEHHSEAKFFDIPYLVIPKGGTKLIICSGNNGGETNFTLEKKKVKPIEMKKIENMIENHKYEGFDIFENVGDELTTINIGKYINSTGNVTSDPGSKYTDFIDIDTFSNLYVTAHARYLTCILTIYDRERKCIGSKGYDKGNSGASVYWKNEKVSSSQILKEYPTAKYVRLCTHQYAQNELYIYRDGATVKEIVNKLDREHNTMIENHEYKGFNMYKEVTNELTTVNTGKYVDSKGNLVDEASSKYTDFIDINTFAEIYVTAHARYSTRILSIYDSKFVWVGAKGYGTQYSDATHWKNEKISSKKLLEEYPTARYVRLCTYQYEQNALSISVEGATLHKIIKSVEDKQQDITKTVCKSNVLYKQKWVACGDSFTEGDFNGYIDENGLSHKNSPKLYDKKRGMYKTYPWWIAERNDMVLINEAKCGSVITNAFEGKKNPFSVDRYLKVPKDAGYITLMFGLNETGLTTEQIGTKTDTTNTTLWGAYNIVFEYFLTNMPYAKIGVIIADAWMNERYANAVKSICEYWGIPVLDLKFNTNVPMGIGGRPNGSAKANQLRDKAFKVTPSNGHPNVEAHMYRSTYIEHWLRSL